eukprot:1969906-Pleurochrysis_carterae.AAC.1
MELTEAKEGAAVDAALRFQALRDSGRCCKFVCETKRFKNVRAAASGPGRRSALFDVCPDAECGKETREHIIVLTPHRDVYQISLLSQHTCDATRLPGSTDRSPRPPKGQQKSSPA